MCCFFDTATGKHYFLTAATAPDYLTSAFKSETIDRVIMEAYGPPDWINDFAVPFDLKTFVCSTNEEAW